MIYESAIASRDSDKWKNAMYEEITALQENETWTLEELPKGQRAIGCKWVYCTKTDSNGNITCYKARLVARGFVQRQGIDYFDTFAPVVRYESIRMLLAIAAKEDYEIAQFDVKTAFLYGSLKEIIYMEQPRGFEDKTKPNAVCKLNKSLYGLQQSPRVWNSKFVEFLKCFNFNQIESDHCVFYGKVNRVNVYLALYVDDGLLLSSSGKAIVKVLKLLEERFQITVGDAKQFVGMEIERNCQNRTIKIGQKIYIQKLLERFRLEEANSVSVPAEPGMHLKKIQCPKYEKKGTDGEY